MYPKNFTIHPIDWFKQYTWHAELPRISLKKIRDVYEFKSEIFEKIDNKENIYPEGLFNELKNIIVYYKKDWVFREILNIENN